jgi:hypothetical protein
MFKVSELIGGIIMNCAKSLRCDAASYCPTLQQPGIAEFRYRLADVNGRKPGEIRDLPLLQGEMGRDDWDERRAGTFAR